MFPTALDDISTEKLEAEVANLYSQISAQTCRWLLLVAELDRREAHLSWGCRSLAHWLSWQCGLALRAAREHVRVARRLEDLPAIRECFSRGELSYSKVRALSRVADAETECDLLEIARNSTGAQLESIARAYRRAMPESNPKEIADRRYARLNWDEDGSLVVSARLSPEEGALFINAFEQAAREELFRERDPQLEAASASEETEAGAARVSRADALVRVAERAQVAADGPVSGGDAHQVVLHLDVAALLGTEVGIGQRCELENVRGSPSRLPGGFRVTQASSRSPSKMASRSRSAARPGRSRPRFGARSESATRAAASPVAAPIASSTPTTSSTGPAAARPRSRIWSASAGTITGCFTRAGSPSRRARAAFSSSAVRTEPSCRHPCRCRDSAGKTRA